MLNKKIIKKEITSRIYQNDEKWEIITENKTYILTGKQVQALKGATCSGFEGFVWFEDFAISISDIIGAFRIK